MAPLSPFFRPATAPTHPELVLGPHAGSEDGGATVAWLDVDLQTAAYRGMYGGHRTLVECVAPRVHGEPELESAWSVAGWLESCALHERVAAALQPPAGADAFEYVRTLSREALEARLSAAGMGALADAVWARLEELRGQGAATAAELSAKFVSDGEAFKGEMQYGSLAVYFGGLEKLKGPPLLLPDARGDRTVREAMRVEHCGRSDCAAPFSTSNGIERATAELEWEFVEAPVVGAEGRYVERGGGFREAHPEWCRVARPLSSFEGALAETNAQLKTRGHVALEWDELVAGRLYTGVSMADRQGPRPCRPARTSRPGRHSPKYRLRSLRRLCLPQAASRQRPPRYP